MKKRLFLVLIASFLLLCACQPTPENPIVVGKDQTAMIEKAQEDTVYISPGQEPETGARAVNWYERLEVPEKYTASLKSAGGHLTVDVDASVLLPDVELPVVRVSPYLFTDEDAHRFVTALLGDNPQCVDPWGEGNRTKKSYEAEILRLKDMLEHWNEYGNYVYGENFGTRENFEKYLHEMMAKAANAPERPETFAPSYEWLIPRVWTSEGEQKTEDRYMTILTVNDDGSQSRLDISRNSEYGRCEVQFQRDAFDDVYYPVDRKSWQNELSIGERDARDIAESKLAAMGLDCLTCTFAKPIRIYPGGAKLEGNPYHACWALVYTPVVNEAALTYTAQTMTEPNEYARAWEYEYCIVMVDENGIAGLIYRNPCTVEEISVPAATLLPFGQIRDIFEKMVMIVDNTADTNNYDEHYRITSVRLGLASIPEQNSDGGLLVPAWDFMGTRVYSDYEYGEDGSVSLLTINAVDGSIITRG